MTEQEWDACGEPISLIHAARYHVGDLRWCRLGAALFAEADHLIQVGMDLNHLLHEAVAENWSSRFSVNEARRFCQQFDSSPCSSFRIHDNDRICTLIREILPPLGRQPRIDPAWRRWNNYVIARLAWTIHRDGCFDELPVLADALEEAGCRDERLLSHCRQSGGHVPGCWAVRLLVFGPE